MSQSRFNAGDGVRVRQAFPPGHVRTPYFVRGRNGQVQQLVGHFAKPEELAYGRDGQPGKPLYRVCFKQTDLWADYEGPASDTLVVDIYEHWLEPQS